MMSVASSSVQIFICELRKKIIIPLQIAMDKKHGKKRKKE